MSNTYTFRRRYILIYGLPASHFRHKTRVMSDIRLARQVDTVKHFKGRGTMPKVKSHKFSLPKDSSGLCLDGRYIPEELLVHIFTYVDPKEMLSLSLVCKQWCRIIRSSSFWIKLYEEKYKTRGKLFPWFVYYSLLVKNHFEKNLLYSGISPIKRCSQSIKYLVVPLDKIPLLYKIIKLYKPHIYCSEYVAGMFECGCIEYLRVFLGKTKQICEKRLTDDKVKLEVIITDPNSSSDLYFIHDRVNPNETYCREHYVSNSIDGEVRVLFDTLRPRKEDKYVVR